jgi:hypothetical protein
MTVPRIDLQATNEMEYPVIGETSLACETTRRRDRLGASDFEQAKLLTLWPWLSRWSITLSLSVTYRFCDRN